MRLLNCAPILLQGIVPPLSERQILRAVRIPHFQRIADVPERGLREAILKAAERASGMASYSAVFRSFPVQAITPEAVVIGDARSTRTTRDTDPSPPKGSDTLLRSASLVRMLQGAQIVTLLAVSLGDAWDAALDELATQKEAAEAWFLDSIGTRLVDNAARLVEDRAASDMARVGLARTRRYRPGYGDFPLEAQAELCDRVGAERIGVRVNEASALLPRKSVTGVVGFQPRGDARADEEPEESPETEP